MSVPVDKEQNFAGLDEVQQRWTGTGEGPTPFFFGPGMFNVGRAHGYGRRRGRCPRNRGRHGRGRGRRGGCAGWKKFCRDMNGVCGEKREEIKVAKSVRKQHKLEQRREKMSDRLANLDEKLRSAVDNTAPGIVGKQARKVEAKQAKMEKKREKLATKLDKVNRKLDKTAPVEQPQQSLCLCGCALVEMHPASAYRFGVAVHCDICGRFCRSSETIFHCPLNRAKMHPNGYDVCGDCVAIQLQSFGDVNNAVVEEDKTEAVAEVEPIFLPTVEIVEESDSEDDVVVAVEVVREPLIADGYEGFEYAKEARAVGAMGFTDTETIKFLLSREEGDVSRVVQRLLSQ